MKTVQEHCLSLGLKIGTADYKREYNAEKWRRTPAEVKRKWSIDKYRRKKDDPVLNEIERERNRKRKAKQREINKDLVNEKQRKYYQNGGQKRRDAINAGKRRRDPTIGLASLIRDVRSGRKQPRELIDRTSAALQQCSALIHRGKGKCISK